MKCILSVVVLTALVCGTSSAPPRPNILFLMCDSMDGRVLDPTSPVSLRMEMPNLRKLALRGTNFIRTHAASPQCVPSRTTMFTGRRTDQIQCWNNGQGIGVAVDGTVDPVCKKVWSEEQCTEFGKGNNVTTTIVDAMRTLNFNTHLYGKVDVGAGLIEETGEENATVAGFHSGPSLSILTRAADIRLPTKQTPEAITNEKDNNVHPEDWKMIEKCIDFLSQHDPEHGGNDNWMLYCSLNIPHPPFDTNATWLAMTHPELITPPPWLPREQFHPADSYMSQSKNVWGDMSDADILKTRQTYYAMCAETDYMLGLVLAAAEKHGHLNNTYVVFLSDHGEMNMEHRQVWKNSLYEASVRVPLIIAGPDIPQNKLVTNLTTLLDVFPTLVDMAGGAQPPSLVGHSLLPLARGQPQPARPTFVTAQYHSNMGNTGSFMLRQGPWKYIAFGTNLDAYNSSYIPQLFNLDTDPDELYNVASAYPDVVASMDALLRSEIPYEQVDRQVKAQDAQLYKRFFADMYSEKQLRNKFESAYTGFGDQQMKKVKAWEAEALNL